LHCYLPVVCFLTFNDEVEQYLVAACCARAMFRLCGAMVFCAVTSALECCFPGVVFRVRLDGGFAAPEVLEFLDRQPRMNMS